MSVVGQQKGSDKATIRPFHVNVPESELTDLRRRIQATKSPNGKRQVRPSSVVRPAQCCPTGRTRADPASSRARLGTLRSFRKHWIGLVSGLGSAVIQ